MLLSGASAVSSSHMVQMPPSPCQHGAVTPADEKDESHRDFALFCFCFILVVVVCMISHRPLSSSLFSVTRWLSVLIYFCGFCLLQLLYILC